MTRVATPATQRPAAPRDPEKVTKPFITKLIDRVTRAIKQVNEVQTRTKAIVAVDGKHKIHGSSITIVGGTIDEASVSLHEALETLAELAEAGYEPSSAPSRHTFAVGAQVWLKKNVWVKKFQPMYKPEELDGMEVVSVNGKLVRAKTASGLQLNESARVFTTTPTSYETADAGASA